MNARPSLLALIAGAALAAVVHAGEPIKRGALELTGAWARATGPQQPNGAAYLVIRNGGPEADRIVAAKADVARKVELHTHLIDASGVARMREIPAIELPADSTVTLEPGGLHVMLLGLQRPLEAGRRFPLTLVLEKAGEVALEVEVRAASGASPGAHGSGHGAHGKSH